MTICILGSEARPPLSNLYMKVTWCDMQERQFQTPNQVFQTCPNKYLNAPSQEWQVNRFGSKVLWIIVSKPQLWAMPKICLPVVLLCWHAETQFRHLFRRTHCHLAHVFQTKNKAHPSSCWHHHTSCHPHHSHDHCESFLLPHLLTWIRCIHCIHQLVQPQSQSTMEDSCKNYKTQYCQKHQEQYRLHKRKYKQYN